MLRVQHRDGVLILEEPVDLQEGANVVLDVLLAPAGGTLGILTIERVHAKYERGELVLRRPLKIPAGCEISVAAFSAVRPLESFRGVLAHVKEDSVALQHKTREWWSQSAH